MSKRVLIGVASTLTALVGAKKYVVLAAIPLDAAPTFERLTDALAASASAFGEPGAECLANVSKLDAVEIADGESLALFVAASLEKIVPDDANDETGAADPLDDAEATP